MNFGQYAVHMMREAVLYLSEGQGPSLTPEQFVKSALHERIKVKPARKDRSKIKAARKQRPWK